MEPELLLDQGVLLSPILMDQDRLIQTEREHLCLEVHNLATVLQVQVLIKRQNIHLVVQLVLPSHQRPGHLFQVMNPRLNILPVYPKVVHPIQQHRGTNR